MRDSTIIFGLIVVTAAATGCGSEQEEPAVGGAGLSSERISSNDQRDLSARVAVDAGGTTHVLWTSLSASGEKQVEYADNRGGAWSGERLTGTDTVLTYDFAVNPGGVAHVIWSDGGIKYRHNGGGSFSATEVISSSATSSWDPSIAAAPDGTLHAAWSEGAGDLLQHALNDGQSWAQQQTIDQPGLDSTPVIATGGYSVPHICWENALNPGYAGQNVLLATFDYDEWVVEPISEDHAGQEVESYECLVDIGGHFHLAYATHDGGNADVYYASNVTGALVRINVSSSPGTHDRSVRLALDGASVAHLVWIKGSESVYYAEVAYDAPSTPVQLSESGRVVIEPRIAAAPDGAVHVVWWELIEEKQYGWAAFEPNFWAAYWSTATGALRYIGSPGYSLEPDVAVGEGGRVHIAHTTYLEREETDREIFLTSGTP